MKYKTHIVDLCRMSVDERNIFGAFAMFMMSKNTNSTASGRMRKISEPHDRSTGDRWVSRCLRNAEIGVDLLIGNGTDVPEFRLLSPRHLELKMRCER